MIIDCIADLHGFYPTLEGGDLLIVAGDITKNDSFEEFCKYREWLFQNSLRYKKIITISGNHDNFMQEGLYINRDRRSWANPVFTYLEDTGTEFEGLKIWGSPWTLTFDAINPKCTAFTGSEEQLADKLEKIPVDTDILITHGPGWLELDTTTRGHSVGSRYLHAWLKYIGRPKYHIFGHIHEAYGQAEVFSGCQSINCSHVNERYEPVNKPVRIII